MIIGELVEDMRHVIMKKILFFMIAADIRQGQLKGDDTTNTVDKSRWD